MATLVRIVGALALLVVAGFSIFGFMASFELSRPLRLPWQIGYAVLGVGCLSGAVLLVRSTRRGG